MPTLREEGDFLTGRQIMVVYSYMDRKPTLLATKGTHNAQSMIVSGDPAVATINLRLSYIPERR